MGGIKDMLSPPHDKTWGGATSPHPPGIYALGSRTISVVIILIHTGMVYLVVLVNI